MLIFKIYHDDALHTKFGRKIEREKEREREPAYTAIDIFERGVGTMKGKTAAALTHGEDFFVFKFDQKDETKRETTKRARKGKKKKFKC